MYIYTPPVKKFLKNVRSFTRFILRIQSLNHPDRLVSGWLESKRCWLVAHTLGDRWASAGLLCCFHTEIHRQDLQIFTVKQAEGKATCTEGVFFYTRTLQEKTQGKIQTIREATLRPDDLVTMVTRQRNNLDGLFFFFFLQIEDFNQQMFSFPGPGHVVLLHSVTLTFKHWRCCKCWISNTAGRSL